MSFKIANKGDSPIEGGVSLDNTNFNIIYQTGCINLLPGKTCNLKISFDPRGKIPNEYNTNLNISNTYVALHANIIAPSSSLVIKMNNAEISELDLGTIEEGSTIFKSLTILNVGKSTVNQPIQVLPPFTLEYDACSGKDLAPQKTCMIKVGVETSGQSGAHTSQLVYDNKTINLITQINPKPGLENIIFTSNNQEITSLDAGVLSNKIAIKVLYVKNIGKKPSAANLLMKDNNNISILIDNCSNAVLNPEKSCQVRVSLDPRGKVAGNYAAVLSLGAFSLNINYQIAAVGQTLCSLSNYSQLSSLALDTNITGISGQAPNCTVSSCQSDFLVNASQTGCIAKINLIEIYDNTYSSLGLKIDAEYVNPKLDSQKNNETRSFKIENKGQYVVNPNMMTISDISGVSTVLGIDNVLASTDLDSCVIKGNLNPNHSCVMYLKFDNIYDSQTGGVNYQGTIDTSFKANINFIEDKFTDIAVDLSYEQYQVVYSPGDGSQINIITDPTFNLPGYINLYDSNELDGSPNWSSLVKKITNTEDPSEFFTPLFVQENPILSIKMYLKNDGQGNMLANPTILDTTDVTISDNTCLSNLKPDDKTFGVRNIDTYCSIVLNFNFANYTDFSKDQYLRGRLQFGENLSTQIIPIVVAIRGSTPSIFYRDRHFQQANILDDLGNSVYPQDAPYVNRGRRSAVINLPESKASDSICATYDSVNHVCTAYNSVAPNYSTNILINSTYSNEVRINFINGTGSPVTLRGNFEISKDSNIVSITPNTGTGCSYGAVIASGASCSSNVSFVTGANPGIYKFKLKYSNHSLDQGLEVIVKVSCGNNLHEEYNSALGINECLPNTRVCNMYLAGEAPVQCRLSELLNDYTAQLTNFSTNSTETYHLYSQALLNECRDFYFQNYNGLTVKSVYQVYSGGTIFLGDIKEPAPEVIDSVSLYREMFVSNTPVGKGYQTRINNKWSMCMAKNTSSTNYSNTTAEANSKCYGKYAAEVYTGSRTHCGTEVVFNKHKCIDVTNIRYDSRGLSIYPGLVSANQRHSYKFESNLTFSGIQRYHFSPDYNFNYYSMPNEPYYSGNQTLIQVLRDVSPIYKLKSGADGYEFGKCAEPITREY